MSDAGIVVGGRYRLLRRVGAGGMGVVHEAHDTVLDRKVAVKVFRSDHARHPEADMERFRREGMALARIRHPNVVGVYDTGMHEREPYLVTEFLDGVSLYQLVRMHGGLPAPVVRLIGAGMCAALAAAHQGGVLHRDVKPSNVAITTVGQVVLQDFGIARLIDQSAVTQANVRLGTPAFMAPESVRGLSPTPATDLYSLGLCLHLALTGEAPLGESDDIGPIIERAVTEGARPLRGRVVGDPELAELVDELCRLEPADRPQSAVEVLERLGPVPAGSPPALTELVRRCLRAEAVGYVRSLPDDEATSLDAPEYLDLWAQGDAAAAVEPAVVPVARTVPEEALSLSMATLQLVMSNMTPENAVSRQREAVNLVLRGELREAARLLTTLSQFCLGRLGPDHPTTLASQYWQAVCLARLGASGEALALFSRVSERAGPGRDEGEGTDVRG
ncbi:serine/threonine-protein kinase [Streptomyces millisiae]|uniref:non-specific serine/threonine protein kinase n=1 Tax=Streptomyces millisiae TaxID=3075542 RepID=A0ABU2LQM9_9ACTN|nr:serine/threonine-protein kinase [Streptomyces sp. DSM 44918]MDT0319894.1 serine/threonine-protein kinase [Streptomyces sp. DSM 44918]